MAKKEPAATPGVTPKPDPAGAPGAKEGRRAETVRFRFTIRSLEAATCPAGKIQHWVFDETQNGLACCIGAKHRTFYHISKRFGVPERVKLGRFSDGMTVEQARELARAEAVKHDRGESTNDERAAARSEWTIGKAFERFIDMPTGRKNSKRERSPKTTTEYRRQFDVYIRAQGWDKKRLSEITRQDIEGFHNTLGAGQFEVERLGDDGQPERVKVGGQIIANRVLALLRAIYNRAEADGQFEKANPAASIERYEEIERDRYLTAGDMPRFFKALDKCEPIFRDFFTVCLLTGARRGNVEAMRFEQIDFKASTWTIPHTKSGKPQVVALVPDMLRLLKRRRAELPEAEWVFPARSAAGHLVEPKTAWADLLKRAGLSDLRIHDLRRTLGSWQAAGGASLAVIGKSLGHRDGSTATKIYSRLSLEPVRDSVKAATRAILNAGRKSRRKN